MADSRYSIPWTPPDIGPGVSMIMSAINANRADERSRAYLDMEQAAVKDRAERESAALARQKEQDQYNRDVAAFTAMPALQRAAMKSVGMANMNPYGVEFDEGDTHAPSLRESGINVMGGNEQYAEHAKQALADEPPSEVAPMDQTVGQHSGAPSVTMGQHSGTPQLEEMGEPSPHDETAEAETVSPPIAAAQALIGQPRQRQVFATYKGQRFEVPPQSETSGFGEKYDAMYNALVEGGEDPHKARAFVAAQAKQDMADTARDKRLAETLGFRSTNREDQQAFQSAENEKYKETHKGRLELIDEAGKFKVAAAGPGFKADAANARDMSLLERAGSAIRQTGQFAKLAASDKTVRGLMLNIANGTTPLQHKDAQIQLARFFRQAQPTEGEMHLLYNNLGGTMDKWNQFVARISNGDLSAEQMRQLKASAAAVKTEHAEDVRRFVNVMKARLGPGGGFDMMPDQAQKLYESMGAELGLENLPPLYGVEGGVTLGSGKRPTVQPRGTKKSALDELESQLDALGGGGGR